MAILLDSKYNSVVSTGMALGISVSPFLEHLTIVPVQVHEGGQYSSPKQPSSDSPLHLNSCWGKSLMRTSLAFKGPAHLADDPVSFLFLSQSENQAK